MTDLDLDLISRCLSGRCTPLERTRFERWIAESADHAAQVAAVRAVAADGDALGSAEWKARARAALTERMAVDGADAKRPRLEVVRGRGQTISTSLYRARSRRLALLRGGAVAAAIAAVGLGARALLFSTAQPAAPSPMRTVATPAGQRAVFRLPDNSRVVLGVASTLRYQVDFRRSRDVVLEGEAYFEVVHDERRPFVVRAGDLRAEDLGTQFVIRAYPGERDARVVVREGKVALRGAADTGVARIVEPGQLGRIGAGGNPVVEAADTAAQFAWTEGLLVFDRTPLRDALPQLGRWYDLEFRLADSALGAIRLSGTFEAQLTDDALDALAAAMGLAQTRHDRIVTFHKVSSSP